MNINKKSLINKWKFKTNGWRTIVFIFINKNKSVNFSTKVNYFEDLSFNIFLIKYSFSFKFKIAKLEYNIQFYENKHNLISPSHLTLYYNFHILCNTQHLNRNISILSLETVDQIKFYKCIEYIDINDTIKFGISIYKNKNYIEYFNKFLFTNRIISYDNISLLRDKKYEPFLIIEDFINLKHKFKVNDREKNKKENLLLKQLYYRKPTLLIKNLSILNENIWYFKNIYNDYFSFCKSNKTSNCSYKIIKEKCKYYFYLNIIDNNRNIYNKTDYSISTNLSQNQTLLLFKIKSSCNSIIINSPFLKRLKFFYNYKSPFIQLIFALTS